MMLHVPLYIPPASTLAAGVACIGFLILLAYLLRRVGRARNCARNAPSQWVVGVVVLVAGFPWYLVIGAVFSPNLRPNFSFWWEIAAGVLWAALTYVIFRRWTSTLTWADPQRWAACFAAMLVCIIAGFLGSSTWMRRDVAFKIAIDLLMIIWMVALRQRLHSRESRLDKKMDDQLESL